MKIVHVLAFVLCLGSAEAQVLETASIRLHTGPVQSVAVRISGPRVTFLALSVSNLLQYAYDLKSYQIGEGPAWTVSDRYDIQLKAEGDGELSTAEARKLVQDLLAERFQAKVHRETKDMPVYLLVTGKSGAKLKENTDTASAYRMMMSSPRRAVVMTVTKGTIKQLADQLSVNLQRPVLDRTGLMAAYDYKLEWLPDGAAVTDEDAPSIYTALEDQLGLRLDGTKTSIEVLTFERVAKPSDN